MTKQELISKLAFKTNISEADALKIIDAFTSEIKDQLARGEKVNISGFGSFVLTQHKAKTFVNPKTGQAQELSDRVLPTFKAGDAFKKNIKKS